MKTKLITLMLLLMCGLLISSTAVAQRLQVSIVPQETYVFKNGYETLRLMVKLDNVAPTFGFLKVDGKAEEVTFSTSNQSVLTLRDGDIRLYAGKAKLTVTVGKHQRTYEMEGVALPFTRGTSAKDVIRSIGMPDKKERYYRSEGNTGIGEHWRFNKYPGLVLSVQGGAISKLNTLPQGIRLFISREADRQMSLADAQKLYAHIWNEKRFTVRNMKDKTIAKNARLIGFAGWLMMPGEASKPSGTAVFEADNDFYRVKIATLNKSTLSRIEWQVAEAIRVQSARKITCDGQVK